MALLNRLSIGKRLLLGFGLTLLFFVTAAAAGLIGIDKLITAEKRQDTKYRQVNNLEELQTMNSELVLFYMDVIIAKNSGQVSEEQKIRFIKFKEELDGDERDIMDPAIFTLFREMLKTGEEQLLPAVTRNETSEIFWINMADHIGALGNQNRELIESLKARLLVEVEQAQKDASNTKKRAGQLFSGLFLAGFILGGLLMFSLRGSLVKPVRALLERTAELAEGDVDMEKRLVVDMDTTDELGKLGGLLNKFLDRFRLLVVKINAVAAGVSTATERISKGGTNLAIRTNEQVAAITETSAAIEEFAVILRQNSESSKEASTMLEKFNVEIQGKKDLITNVTATMTEISDSSKRIDSIVKVINDISFQTNLLALNAAVEAARAGEAGRGFAVVAAEVRNLAQKTAESSRTIQDIVTQNVESTQKGMELIKVTSNFFEVIVNTCKEMTDKIQQIAGGSREQAGSVVQINQAIAQLETAINQNASLVDEFSSTGKQMKASADDLTQLTAHFKTGKIKEALSSPATQPKPPFPTTLTKKIEAQKKEPAVPRGQPQIQPSAKAESLDDFFASDEGGFEEF